MLGQMDIYETLDEIDAEASADFREIATGLPARPGVIR